MTINDLTTPNYLVDLDQMDNNIESVQKLCDENNKELWPMVKTHKSSQIIKKQKEAGAEGFLTGTLDEAETLSKLGIKKITHAYPVAGDSNIDRIININKNTDFYTSIDSIEQIIPLNEKLEENNMKMKVLIIIDSGLNRFGVKPKDVVSLVNEIKKYKKIIFAGFSTHSGQVYSSNNMEDIKKYFEQEKTSINTAKDKLLEASYEIDMIATGSTPTMSFEAEDKNITILRPGAYVFYDNIQMSMDVVEEKSCALTILITVISNPEKGLYLIDAGSKTFALDKGAHGISSINGFGYVKNHPELIISDLSEEVGKIEVNGTTDIKIGDKLRVIPNHVCPALNNTDYLIGLRGEEITEIINIDMRSGSVRKPPSIQTK